MLAKLKFHMLENKEFSGIHETCTDAEVPNPTFFEKSNPSLHSEVIYFWMKVSWPDIQQAFRSAIGDGVWEAGDSAVSIFFILI